MRFTLTCGFQRFVEVAFISAFFLKMKKADKFKRLATCTIPGGHILDWAAIVN